MATGTSNVLNIKSAGIPNYSGTAFSAITLTQHDLLIGGASNAITSLALTNGQLAIGNSGSDPSAATLTAGAGVTIANAAGSITISAAGTALTWVAETTSFSANTNHGYAITNSGATTVTLPATASLGDTINIVGLPASTTAWVIQITGTGTMTLGTTTGGGGGTLTATTAQDSATIVSTTTGTAQSNPNWQVIFAVGNLTVA